jgi:hypothetical protein
MYKLTYTVACALVLTSGAVSTYGLTKIVGSIFVIAVLGLLFEAAKAAQSYSRVTPLQGPNVNT